MTGQAIVVVGAQWGDEGKGKIVDLLTEFADLVVRFQGGDNAGHTVFAGDEKIVLHLIPSGIARPHARCMIGDGVVVNPRTLLDEIRGLNTRGISVSPDNLCVGEGASLILPLHVELDKLCEERRGKGKIGTTGRGIGPAYEDRVARRDIRFCYLADRRDLDARLPILLDHHNALRRGYGVPELDPGKVRDEILAASAGIMPFVGSVSTELEDAYKCGKKTLFEGAQGAMLDKDHGTCPYVTSSNTVSPQAAIGAGIDFHWLQTVIGVMKAYTTRVGEGPFPTELTDEIGEMLRKRGGEFGATTGRPRRCGWLDTVQVRKAIRIGGIGRLAMTKLDVLDGQETINVCIGYRLGGKVLYDMPASPAAQAEVQPIYHTIAGWREPTAGIASLRDLPEEAQAYIRYIEDIMEVPIDLISNSAKRAGTIIRRNPFVGMGVAA